MFPRRSRSKTPGGNGMNLNFKIYKIFNIFSERRTLCADV